MFINSTFNPTRFRVFFRVRFIPKQDEDEFAWQCSNGHWNKRTENMCRQCHEAKPEQPEVLRGLLEKIAEQHPRNEVDSAE